MLQAKFLTLAELSEATGRSEDWWRRNWLRMHEQHEFPRRLPGLWNWSRPAVEAWAQNGGKTPLYQLPANQNDQAPDLAEATARLKRLMGLAN